MYMGLHIPGTMCVGVTLWFGWGGVVSVCWLKSYWSVHVECGGWGLMTVLNRGFISPVLKLVSLYSTIRMVHGPGNIR